MVVNLHAAILQPYLTKMGVQGSAIFVHRIPIRALVTRSVELLRQIHFLVISTQPRDMEIVLLAHTLMVQ